MLEDYKNSLRKGQGRLFLTNVLTGKRQVPLEGVLDTRATGTLIPTSIIKKC